MNGKFSNLFNHFTTMLFVWSLITICGAMLLIQIQLVEYHISFSFEWLIAIPSNIQFYRHIVVIIWWCCWWHRSKFFTHSPLCTRLVSLVNAWIWRSMNAMKSSKISAGIYCHVKSNECYRWFWTTRSNHSKWSVLEVQHVIETHSNRLVGHGV